MAKHNPHQDFLARSPVGVQPLEEQPLEEQPLEEQPLEEQPLEEQPLEEQPLEEQPLEEQPLLTTISSQVTTISSQVTTISSQVTTISSQVTTISSQGKSCFSLLRAGSNFKTGENIRFEKRLRQIKLQRPDPVEVVHLIRTSNPLQAEHQVARALSKG